MSQDVEKNFDLIVIGAGPGGYVAAIRAALDGKTVALVERESVGGTCLNWGCIPTKTLLAHAERWHLIQQAALFGIDVDNPRFSYDKMVVRKDDIVTRMRKSLEGLIASHKIKLFKGQGSFISPTQVSVAGGPELNAPKIIIATGSEPRQIPPFTFDGKRVHNSSSILGMTTLPKTLAIIGGGVIGCEFASLFAEFGVKVTILEAMPSILPFEAKAVSGALATAYAKKGIQIHTGVQVTGCQVSDDKVVLKMADKEIETDVVLVAIGRSLNTAGLGLDKAGVKLSDKGAIEVNDYMQTNVPSIYAIGDVTAKVMLAHVASHQGIIAAMHASGHAEKMDYLAVPNVIFTSPEIATVGLSLEKAEEKGYDAVVGKFPFIALGKAVATMQTEGFAQVVLERNTHQILGAQVVGAEASSLIAPMVLAIQHELTAESIATTIHAHPTMAEAWHEAIMVGMGLPIHLPPTARPK